MRALADTRFSILELAPVREGHTIQDALHHALTLAQHAEKLGFERLWLAEHHNMAGIASSATSGLYFSQHAKYQSRFRGRNVTKPCSLNCG